MLFANELYTVLANPFYCADSNKSKGKVKCCKNQCTGCWKVETA